jgi:DNA-directed RNA polymerase specialized sigma24 family protein
MDQRAISSRTGARAISADALIESHYLQFVQWAGMLTRGDAGLAEEIVQELCLELTLSSPDFSQIQNLDGYLYTCLRHLYLSRLARASREAIRFVSIEDCDSIQFALETGRSIDSLEVQNQLRRICSYSLWRKEVSKAFSCFILHFFHGYVHREIADVAILPMPAIYNKLKSSRAEIKSHLQERGKLRFSSREVPPEATLFWTAVPTPELFSELRKAILAARRGACLPEAELIACYESPNGEPVPCALLAHIVSCERCLAALDRHFHRPALHDRDGLDGYDELLRIDAEPQLSRARAMLDGIHRRTARIYEHRPSTLSIAVDGKIIAQHNVHGDSSVLSARLERPEHVQFVEVFSDQNVRLALLPVESLPPEGAFPRRRRIPLSDERWLELRLTFDGLGLDSELTYFDPALGVAEIYEPGEETLFSDPITAAKTAPESSAAERTKPSFPGKAIQLLKSLWPSSPGAWTFATVCLMAAVGVIAWHYAARPLNSEAILEKAVVAEAEILKGNAEHQTFQIELMAADGQSSAHGTIDVWKDPGTGRRIRRLYDTDHHLMASEWQDRNGFRGSNGARRGNNQLIAGGLWTTDVSPQAFHSLESGMLQGRATETGYELTSAIHDQHHPELVSATLVLNSRFMPVSEILRLRKGAGIRQIRYTQTGFESLPSSSVPDSVFSPDSLNTDSRRLPNSSDPGRRGNPFTDADADLPQLELAVLYRLFDLRADADQPLLITRTPDHRVRVEGTIADDLERRRIVDGLKSLGTGSRLDLRIVSAQQSHLSAQPTQPKHNPSVSMYTVEQAAAPGDAILRKHLSEGGVASANLDAAVTEFEHNALAHAQRALQQSYALSRLGAAFTADELRTVPPEARLQWATMAAAHTKTLETELQALQHQMAELTPISGQSIAEESIKAIDTPNDFAHVSTELLHQIQMMNQSVVQTFTAGVPERNDQSGEKLIRDAANSIPMTEAETLTAFAVRLTEKSEQESRANPSPRQNP